MLLLMLADTIADAIADDNAFADDIADAIADADDDIVWCGFALAGAEAHKVHRKEKWQGWHCSDWIRYLKNTNKNCENTNKDSNKYH